MNSVVKFVSVVPSGRRGQVYREEIIAEGVPYYIVPRRSFGGPMVSLDRIEEAVAASENDGDNTEAAIAIWHQSSRASRSGN